MTVTRHYIMQAKAGESAPLQTALEKLAEAVRPLPGCLGAEILRDIGDEHGFVFMERWDSIEAHKAASAQLPKDVLVPLGDLLDGPPEGVWLDTIGKW